MKKKEKEKEEWRSERHYIYYGVGKRKFGVLKFPKECPLVPPVMVVSTQSRELTRRYTKVMSS